MSIGDHRAPQGDSLWITGAQVVMARWTTRAITTQALQFQTKSGFEEGRGAPLSRPPPRTSAGRGPTSMPNISTFSRAYNTGDAAMTDMLAPQLGEN